MSAPRSRFVRRCEVSGCGRRHHGRGYCRAHHARWRRHGDPIADAPVIDRANDGPSYWQIGQRLQTELGPASGRRCAGCAAPAACWSYDGTDPDEQTDPARGHRYSFDPDHYLPRCRSCHRRATLARTRPRARTEGIDTERAARLYRAGASAAGVAALLGVSRTAVHTALRHHGVAMRGPGRRITSAPEIVIEEHR